jgi:ribose transport system permease protein
MSVREINATGPALKARSLIARIVQRLGAIRELGLLLIILVFVFVLTVSNPGFLTKGNLIATGSGSAGILIVTVGMTVVLISGGFDLSVGGVVALSGVIMLELIQVIPSPLALLVAIAAGLTFGLANGFLIAKVGINPLITTLGTLGMARGLAQVLSGGTIVSPPGGVPAWFIYIGNATIFGVPLLIVWAISLVIIFDVLVRRGNFFRQVYFVGGSERAARYVGINVPRLQMSVYLICSLLATLAGLLLASRFEAATATFGTSYELQAISAAVIGGAALGGGSGTIFGAFLAVVLLALVQDAIVIYSISVFWQDFIYGAILVVSVALTLIGSRGSLFREYS